MRVASIRCPASARGLDRATRDLDILTSPLVRDAQALLRALGAIDDRLPKPVPVSMLTAPLRRMPIPDADGIAIDLLTSIEAIDFEQGLWAREHAEARWLPLHGGVRG